MPEAVVDLLETVHVADHQRERDVVTLAAGQFAVELQKQRPGIGQAGEVIGGGGAFRLLVLESILDGQSHLAAHRQKDAQVVRSERIFLGAIESDNPDHARHSLQRQGERRTQRAEFVGIVQVAGFHRRVSIHNRFLILRHPTRKPVPYRNPQRGKQAVVVSVHIFRDQDVVAQNVDGDRVVGNHRSEFYGEDRERFTRAE